MISSNNFTTFGMHSDAVRYSWAIYHLFVLLSSFIGDTLILMASVHKDAFKVNKSIVTIIQHIAISDILISSVRVLPTTVSLFANKWILGDALCYIIVYAVYFSYPAGMYLIAFLTISKFLILRNPLTVSKWPMMKMVNIVIVGIWTFQIVIPVLFLFLGKRDIHFDYRIYFCDYRYQANKIWKELLPVITVVYTFIPNVIIIATTIPTLRYLAVARKCARRVNGSVPWHGGLAVAITAAVYCLSTLPMSICYICKNFFPDPTGVFQFQLYRVGFFLSMINIMSNFFIYIYTSCIYTSCIYTSCIYTL